MKKLAVFMIVLAVVLTIIPFAIYGYNKYLLYDIKHCTYDHLIMMGYKELDIVSVTPKVGKLPMLKTQVIFKDEPQVIYEYKKDNGEIIQLRFSNDVDFEEKEKYKHIEW